MTHYDQSSSPVDRQVPEALGRYGEHELEALHHRYKEYRTRRFICSNKSKPSYSPTFFKACVTLNADAT